MQVVRASTNTAVLSRGCMYVFSLKNFLLLITDHPSICMQMFVLQLLSVAFKTKLYVLFCTLKSPQFARELPFGFKFAA